jgi:hypothetical protein
VRTSRCQSGLKVEEAHVSRECGEESAVLT